MVLFHVFPLIAGVYYCAEGSVAQAVPCMQNNGTDPWYLADETRRFEDEGVIDPVSGMSQDRVFLLHGELDNVVDPGMAVCKICFSLNPNPILNRRVLDLSPVAPCR